MSGGTSAEGAVVPCARALTDAPARIDTQGSALIAFCIINKPPALEAAVKTRNVSKKLVDLIDEGRALAGTADFTRQFAGDLAALVALARKRDIDDETIAAKLREAANALGKGK